MVLDVSAAVRLPRSSINLPSLLSAQLSSKLKDPMDQSRRDDYEQSIVKKFGGIFPPFEAFYLQGIIYAAGRCVNSFQQFDDISYTDTDASKVVAIVQEALTHAGALSRYFWPSPKRKNKLALARANKLRYFFDLHDNSPLRYRALRDALEHFDERLDHYLIGATAGSFFPGPLIANADLASEPTGHFFRLVDPEKQVCVICGEKFAFGPIRNEVERVYSAACEMDDNGSRLNRQV